MVKKLTSYMKTLARKNRNDLTGPEIKLWFELREFKQIGAHFRKQVPMEKYILDFVCHSKKLVIELDGDSHGDDLQKRKDEKRDAWLKSQGYTVMRVWNGELYDNLDGVLDDIYRYLISHHPTPNPSPSRRGEQEPVPPSPSWGGIEGGGSLNKNAARKPAPRKQAPRKQAL